MQIVKDFPGVLVYANREQLVAFVCCRGLPYLFAPDDRRRPTSIVNGDFPRDILRFRPFQRQTRGIRVPVAAWSAELPPVFMN